MGVRKDDLTQYIQQLETLKADIPAIMSKIAAGEGAYAVKQARLICKNDNVINTGAYRRNWQSDKTAKRSGRRYIVRFYNPLDYASCSRISALVRGNMGSAAMRSMRSFCPPSSFTRAAAA